MANSEQLTHAQMIDPGMRLAMDLGQNPGISEIEPGRKLNLGRGLALLTVAGSLGLVGGVFSETVDEAGEASAEGFCPPGQVDVNWFDDNQNGIPDVGDSFTCVPINTTPPPPAPTTPPPSPTTPPPSGGGGSSSGGSTSGGGSTVVTSPPKPTYEQILAFVGCEDDKGNPALASELEDLKGTDGSGRLVTLIDWCELDYIEENGIMEGYGRPNSNWENLIKNPDLNITPNDAQINYLNIYLLDNWNQLNAPAPTTTESQTTTSISSTSTSSSTTEAPTTTEVEDVADTTEVTQTTEKPEQTSTSEVQEQESTSTTEAVLSAVNESDESGEDGRSWPLPVGIVGGAAVLGALTFIFTRRRRNEEESPGLSGTSPVAGN